VAKVRIGKARQPGGVEEIPLQTVIPIGIGSLHCWKVAGAAGTGDQNVESPQLRDSGRDNPFKVSGACDIPLDGEGLSPSVGYLAGSLTERCFRPRDKSDPCPLGSEATGDGLPDAAACSGDQGDFPGEL
jgi:hypothetical protein